MDNLQKSRPIYINPKSDCTCGISWSVIAAIALCILAIALRIYKANITGIIYDESVTFFTFSLNIKDALTKYPDANNHVLNSILIFFSWILFGFYEHFIRIPAILSSVAYVLASCWVCYRLIGNRLLALSTFAVLAFSTFIFDMSILARGYAIANGASLVLLALILRFAVSESGNPWRFVPWIIITNFLAEGAMLSSVYFLAACNLAFLFLVWQRKDFGMAALKKTFLVGSTIFMGSLIPLFLLYFRLFHKIRTQMLSSCYKPLHEYIINAFATSFLKSVYFGTSGERLLDVVGIVLVAVIAVGLIQTLKRGTSSPGAFAVALILTLYLTLLAIASYALRSPMGFPRNQMLLFILTILFAAVGAECLAPLLSRLCKTVGEAFPRGFAFLLLAVLVLSAPSLRVVNVRDWQIQSAVGPILRQLEKRAPGTVWNFRLTQKTRFCFDSFRYYAQFRNRYHIAMKPDGVNLILCSLDDPAPLSFTPFMPEYFNAFLCRVYVKYNSAAEEVTRCQYEDRTARTSACRTPYKRISMRVGPSDTLPRASSVCAPIGCIEGANLLDKRL